MVCEAPDLGVVLPAIGLGGGDNGDCVAGSPG